MFVIKVIGYVVVEAPELKDAKTKVWEKLPPIAHSKWWTQGAELLPLIDDKDLK